MASLTGLNQAVAVAGVMMSSSGLHQRFTAEAAEFMRRLLAEAVTEMIEGQSVAIPVLQRFTAVHIQDSTVINLPEALSNVWQGCNGAALKVQVCWNLLRGGLVYLGIRPGRENDRASPIRDIPLPAGALWLADLGYFSLSNLRHIAAQRAFYLTRIQANCQVLDAEGRLWSMDEFLSKQNSLRIDVEVQMGKEEHLPCRLLAARVPQDVAEERRRKLRAEAKRRGKTLSPRRLALADWTILMTNAPTTLLLLDEALVVVRVRWQIELLFKLWKSVGHVDEWSTSQPQRILCETYAKLLGCVIQHWVMLTDAWRYPDRSLVKIAQIIQTHAMTLAHAVAAHSFRQLKQLILSLHRCFASVARTNTRRANPSTSQLLLALSTPEALT